MIRSPAVLIVSAAVIVLAAIAAFPASRTAGKELLRGYAAAPRSAALPSSLPADPAARGAVLFAAGDFGVLNTDALNTVAVPWKLASTALVMADPQRRTPAEILGRYGFLSPERMVGLPTGQGLDLGGMPLGLNAGLAHRGLPRVDVEIANLGCASCHSSVAYDGQGRPDPSTAWLGSPNSSLDLEAYTQDLYAALRDALRDEPKLLREMKALHPTISDAEMNTMRRHVIPLARKRIAALERAGKGPLPFSNGLPGLTNGVAALKLQAGLVGANARTAERGFVSIPQLADRGWRSSLLADGAYAPVGKAPFQPVAARDQAANDRALAAITTYFTVPSMGQAPERARAAIPQMADVIAFLRQNRPQPFPGAIDAALAARGGQVYAAACASCHGTYEDHGDGPRLASFPNWHGDVGTDRTRAEVMTVAVADRINAGPYGGIMTARRTGGYVAPPLTGLWSSAPYLHNGSVPSIAQLLELEPREAQFRVGGHAVDLARLGISYPEGYQPWSRPALIDTRQKGLGNQGHEAQVMGLSVEARRDLIEYLKRL